MANAAAVYGSQGRIGLIVPANNSVIEPEVWSVLPPDVAAFATRVMAKGDLTPDAIYRMEADVDQAVDAISATGVDVIAYCDMVTTFIMEPGWNERAVERFGRRSGTPVISAWTALRDAMGKLGVRRICLGTPYPRDIHALASPFFEQQGIALGCSVTLDIVAMREVPTVGRERLMAFVENLDWKGSDAIVLLATYLPTFGSIGEIEQRTGLPVLTSNQTLLWKALSVIGTRRPARLLGRLFEV
jgi:maleate isomerase